ncbi:hypothetical protein ADU59_27955 [Pararhizobium polonicum]|uniref:Threonine transporter RhtB n=1 Tax=Pararhizobium polonicum TaxID=1612624 RepID=A0A1C7NT47_9HYPH|nr:hypothetical protein [Pararhizobium polonicum]OBZ92172.1 hypothetical protein ADU59_27955 [Pararhizobium polonicum]
MTYSTFLFAVLALLLAPGPTNTLIGLAGAQRGLPSLWRLLPAELIGYLTMILPAAWFGAMMIERWPMATVVLKLVAAAWVMYLAIRLWAPRSAVVRNDEVTAKRVYITTALNPKALIVAFVLLPAPTDEQFLLKLALFCVTAAGVALVWGAFGTVTRSKVDGSDRLTAIRRVASIWLAIVSGSLILAALS